MADKIQSKADMLISVIVPCYNQARYLAEALDSVKYQTYTSWECIIVDDGSPDDTADVAKRFCNLDKRFKYLKKENGGLSSARNAGLQFARGVYIQFLDADDFIHKEKFLSAANYINNFPECNLVLCNFKLYNDNLNQYTLPEFSINKHITFKDIITDWDIAFVIPIHCGIIKKEIMPEFNEQLKAKEDWLFWIEIFKHIKDYHFINEFYAFYRRHNNNMTNEYEFIKENTLSAYVFAHNIVNSPELKNIIFSKYHHYSTEVIKKNKKDLQLAKKSYSYKVGNLVLKPFSFFKQLISSSK